MKRILVAVAVILCASGLRASDFYAADGITNIAFLINRTTTYDATSFYKADRWQCGTVPDQDDVIVVTNYDNAYSEGAYGKNNDRYNDITVRDAGIMTFSGNRDHKFFGRITVEDGGLFKMTYGADWVAGAYFKPSLVFRILPGGKFWCNRNVREEPTLNSDCVLAGGELIFGHPSLYVYSAGSSSKITTWFKGTCALKGTALVTDNVGAKDADSVFNLEAGSLTLKGTEDGGLWTTEGGCLNFTPYSTCELLVTNGAVVAEDVYAAYFAGETPRIRYNGNIVASGDFTTLFAVTDGEDGYTHIVLKPQTSDVILVDGQTAATRTYDNQELKPLDNFRVKYPATGATVAYSLDDGVTWLDAIPRIRNAGTHTVKVKVTADGFADVVTTYTHTVLPRDASSFTFSAPDVNYTGSPVVPDLTINDTEPFCGTLVAGTDYDTVCTDNVNPGTATCTVNYKGNYKGTRATTFKIIAPKRAGDIVVDPSAPAGGDGTKEKPLNSFSDACNMAANGAHLKLAAGSHVINTACTFAQAENITVEGPASGVAVVRPQTGVSMRHFNLTSVTNITFKNVQFRDAALELDPLDATTAQGGSFRILNSTNVAFVGCAFVSNVVQNTLTDTTSVHEQGGAIYALETALQLTDCTFEANGAVAKYATRFAYGGALYLYRTDVDGDQNKLRYGLTATNCVFRGNFGYSADGTVVGALYSAGWGLDFYNCLIAGNYAKSTCPMMCPVYCTGRGAFQRYTQSTIADNGCANAFIGGTSWNWNSRQATPILIRSVVCGQLDDFDMLGDYQPAGVQIDSVYSTGHAPVASATQCGLTYTSSNFARATAADLVWQEGQVIPGSAAAVRDAGWRPTPARTYATWYVAESGSDANAGTEASPFRTLTKALQSAGNGDTIRLAAGRYTQTAGETFPLVFKDRYGLTVVGAGREATFIDGEGNTTDVSAFEISSSYGVRFKDLSITGMDSKTKIYELPAVMKVVGTASIRFDRVGIVSNVITQVKHTVENKTLDGALRIDCAGLVDFTDCVITGNVCKLCQSRHGSFARSTAWLVTSTCGYIRFLDCLIAENGYDVSALEGASDVLCYNAFLFQSVSARYRIANCLIRNNGIQAGTVTSLHGDNNHFYLNTGSNQAFFDLDNCTIVDNVNVRFMNSLYATPEFFNTIVMHEGPVFGALQNGVAKNTLFSRTIEDDPTIDKIKTKENCIYGGDPKFKDAAKGNYSLEADSPCIDAGIVRNWMNEDATGRDGQDFAGNARLVGYKVRREKLPDLGCYERQRNFGMAIIVR